MLKVDVQLTLIDTIKGGRVSNIVSHYCPNFVFFPDSNIEQLWNDEYYDIRKINSKLGVVESDGIIIIDNSIIFKPGESHIVNILFYSNYEFIKKDSVWLMREGVKILGICNIIEIVGDAGYNKPNVNTYEKDVAFAINAWRNGMSKENILFCTDLCEQDIDNIIKVL
jgi:hypothetical protein